jgi:hypothetical protein
MDENAQRRIGRNESLFRETNEAIERGHWPNEPGTRVRFRCECARLDCNAAVELTLAEYEYVRAEPHRFVLVPGHELPEVEDVISCTERYAVVEKRQAAAAEAAAEDPRH